MLFEYKNTKEKSKLRYFKDFENNDDSDDYETEIDVLKQLENFDSDFQNFLLYLEGNDANNIIGTLNSLCNLKNIYKIPNVVSRIIESGMLAKIMNHIELCQHLIYELIYCMVKCPINELEALIDNDLISFLFNGAHSADENTYKTAIETLIVLLQRHYSIYALVILNGIFQHIMEILQNDPYNEDLNPKICCLLYLIGHYLLKGVEIYKSAQNHVDMVQCSYSEFGQLFTKNGIDFNIFLNILSNSINLSKGSELYEIFMKLFQIVSNIADEKVIIFFLEVLNIILSESILSNDLFFEIPIADKFQDWIALNKDDIDYELQTFLYNYLICLGKENINNSIIEEMISIVTEMFDKYCGKNNVLEKYTLKLLWHIFDLDHFTESKEVLQNFATKSRKKKILSQAANSPYKIMKEYLLLCLYSAVYSDDPTEFFENDQYSIFDTIIDNISNFSDKFAGHALKCFQKIFKIEEANSSNEFKIFFQDKGGLDLLYDLMDNHPNEYIRNFSTSIVDTYFNNGNLY